MSIKPGDLVYPNWEQINKESYECAKRFRMARQIWPTKVQAVNNHFGVEFAILENGKCLVTDWLATKEQQKKCFLTPDLPEVLW